MEAEELNPLGESVKALCRVCLSEDEVGQRKAQLPDPLLSPCLCNGTVKWVHRSCLERWRAEKQGTPYAHYCELCGARYALRSKTPSLLRYIWTQWSTTEKFFYLAEFASIFFSVSSSVSAYTEELSRTNLAETLTNNAALTLPLPPYLSSLSTSPTFSLILIALPRSAIRIARRVSLLLFLVHHYSLYGRTDSSKVGIYLCAALTTIAHFILFKKWQEENAEETLCDRKELEAERLVEERACRTR